MNELGKEARFRRTSHSRPKRLLANAPVCVYGKDTWKIFGDARQAAELGRDFGATLTAREVDWLMTREYAHTAHRLAIGARVRLAEGSPLSRG